MVARLNDLSLVTPQNQHDIINVEIIREHCICTCMLLYKLNIRGVSVPLFLTHKVCELTNGCMSHGCTYNMLYVPKALLDLICTSVIDCVAGDGLSIYPNQSQHFKL